MHDLLLLNKIQAQNEYHYKNAHLDFEGKLCSKV